MSHVPQKENNEHFPAQKAKHIFGAKREFRIKRKKNIFTNKVSSVSDPFLHVSIEFEYITPVNAQAHMIHIRQNTHSLTQPRVRTFKWRKTRCALREAKFQ